ncbi:MAG TPA: sugar kinase [Chitinophagaceae bacterium]|nr:sugar kinase [Chitinophagaceae bacterium]
MNENTFNIDESSKVAQERDLEGAVFCFGELMLRLSPELGGKWIHDQTITTHIGGAELNVATALANWKVPVKYCTALPDNYLSKEICEELGRKSIDTSSIHFSGNRIGVYYLPKGAELKSAGVIYDRAYSSFGELKVGMINWNDLLKDSSWFHFSAITPALNENIAEVCSEALEVASAKKMTISVDLNFRAKLWKYGKQPADIMPGLVKYCNVIMGNLWAVESLLGIGSSIKESEGKSKEELVEAAGKSMLQLHRQYPKAEAFAYTFRLDKEYFGVLQHGPEMAVSKTLEIKNVVDKAGSGDCFMGGLIYGLTNNHKADDIINFAASAAVGKLGEEGDSTKQTIEQVKQRMKLDSVTEDD